MQPDLKNYKKSFEYSYSFGAFPTMELLQSQPDAAIKIFMSKSFADHSAAADISDICSGKGIPAEINDKIINRLSPKENCYVIGVFKKYETLIDRNRPHIVLVNPGNMGNMGTIIRTCLGFGLRDLAIISPGADIFDPKVVRASMGALFKIRYQYFGSFEEYRVSHKDHRIYTFMLDGAKPLEEAQKDCPDLFTLVFGNESSGLGAEFRNAGTSVVIPHSDRIDSLNLTIAVGIAAYEFTKVSIKEMNA